MLINDRYEVIKLIGSGGMAKVYLVNDINLNMYKAVKVINLEVYKTVISNINIYNRDKYSNTINMDNESINNEILSMVYSEINALKTLDYCAFPKIMDAIVCDDNAIIVMEYIDGISLDKKINKRALSNNEAYTIIMKLVEACAYLHSLSPRILLLDIKPSNIIITTSGDVKIVDLGSAIIGYDMDNMNNITGTKGFASPEQMYASDKYHIMIDERSDIYSIGATYYACLSGRSPWNMRMSKIPLRQLNPTISRGIESIVERCLNEDRDERYQSISSLERALKKHGSIDFVYRIGLVLSKMISVILILVMVYLIYSRLGGAFEYYVPDSDSIIIKYINVEYIRNLDLVELVPIVVMGSVNVLWTRLVINRNRRRYINWEEETNIILTNGDRNMIGNGWRM